MHTFTSKYSLNVTVSFLLLTLFAFTLNRPFSTPIPTDAIEHANHASVAKTYDKLPMSFEVNEGQVDERVSFLSRGRGYNLFLTSNAAVLSLNVKHDVLRMKLLDANPSTRAIGLKELPGKSNYLIGNDPKQWRTNVAHYARVKYEAVYPGVDLVYYGKQEKLEYDFIVAPGTDPSTIKQVFEGTEGVKIDEEGELILRTRSGELRQHKPFIYQQTDDGHKRQIAGRYVKTGKHQIGFEVDEYNPDLPLVIDPVLVYSSYLGGSGDDQVLAIATDGAGNAYVAGPTTSAAFPTTAGAFQPIRPGGTDTFVTKLDPSGSVLVYSTYLGGSLGSEYTYALKVDNQGHAYVTGSTSSIDFPTTLGVVDPVPGPATDGFVTKLSPSGSSLIYSTFLGGSSSDIPQSIAIDGAGQVSVTGYTFSLDFPTTLGAFDTTFNGVSSNEDAFVTKLNATASGFIYSTFLGGSGRDLGTGLALDSSGNTYVTGYTTSTNLPTTFGAFDRFLGGTGDSFVTKLNATGSGIVYSTYLGGSGSDVGLGVAVDAAAQAYVVGYTGAFDFPVTGSAFDRVFSGGVDVFVTKLTASGAGLSYSTFLGGSGFDVGFGIAVDGLGQAYVTGHTNSSTFPTTFGAFDTSYGGGGPSDAFMTKLSASGSTLSYSTFVGGNSSNDEGRGIVIDVAGKVYVGGTTSSVDFPTTVGAYDTSHNGAIDGFITQFQFP